MITDLFSKATKIRQTRNRATVSISDAELITAALMQLTEAVDSMTKEMEDSNGTVTEKIQEFRDHTADWLETINFSISRNTDATVNS